MVGDDDQALYHFRGGTVTCMVRFAHECQEEWPESRVHQVALTQTYRSHPQIVIWINAFIEAQSTLCLPGARVADKPSLEAMRSPRVPGPVVYAVRGSSAETTATAFAQLIADLLNRRIIESPSQCALLAHSIKESTIYQQPRRERSAYEPSVQQKISKTFRSHEGATAFCVLRSYLSTMRKQGRSILASLVSVFEGSPFPIAWETGT